MQTQTSARPRREIDDMGSPIEELESYARSLALLGDWGGRAIEVNSKIIKVDDRSINALNRLARCHLLAKRREAAREAYERVLSIDPQNKIALNAIDRLGGSMTRTIERHKAFLEKVGLQYKGTCQATPRNRRITHCWHCKHALDNAIDVECMACGWILCGCGACGCSRV